MLREVDRASETVCAAPRVSPAFACASAMALSAEAREDASLMLRTVGRASDRASDRSSVAFRLELPHFSGQFMAWVSCSFLIGLFEVHR